jgi:signal transduction histidine kinase
VEGELRTLHQDLAKCVEERTAELTEVNERLTQEIHQRQQLQKIAERANRAKSEFLANMNHELRTPLAHIIGFTELVLNKQVGPLNVTQEEYLQDVLHSSNHLLTVITDVLDLVRLETGKLKLDLAKVDLKRLVEHSLAMVEEKSTPRSIRLSADIHDLPESIIADGRKLKQSIDKLLSNAEKFTPDGGAICISAKQMTRDELQVPRSVSQIFKLSQHALHDAPQGTGNFIEISVSDTGIGLKQEDLTRIFNPFEQVEQSAGREYQGIGLGLMLTKTFVELHGGQIWAQSEGAGKGTTFTFIIPIQNTPKSVMV